MKLVKFQDIPVRIDRPKGFVQRGKDASGKPWERTYGYDYGYIPKTEGGDGEGVDVFLGPHADADEAYWVSQMKEDGRGDEIFDEFKVFLGFRSKEDAKRAYFEHIPRKFYHSTVTMKVPLMRAMLGIDPGPAKTAGFLAGVLASLSRGVASPW